MEHSILAALNAERQARRAAILVTDLDSGQSYLLREGDAVDPALAEPVSKAFRTGLSGSAKIEGRNLFLTTSVPSPRFVVIGAVHISQALAQMARVADYDMEIIDPRTAFATAERFPTVPLHADWPEAVLARRPLDAYTAVAALTHDPKIDDFALKAALDAGCFYVGALGSRKTHAARTARLVAQGATEGAVSRIRAPIGLDIGAATPAEIAVAILGEVVKALRTRGTEPR